MFDNILWFLDSGCVLKISCFVLKILVEFLKFWFGSVAVQVHPSAILVMFLKFLAEFSC